MKIMSALSWIWRCRMSQWSSHNASSGPSPARMTIHPTSKEIDMKWEKPQASDMRWGFEITMYIANR